VDDSVSAGRPLEPVEVSIGGRRYRLRGSDPEQLHALARRVDRTLDEIVGAGGARDDFKVAVLAALNIAGDQEEQRARWLDGASRLREAARRLEERLDRLENRIEREDA
jgi:cell division protein ZapA (FtsZ GTPase activity inhibitor)